MGTIHVLRAATRAISTARVADPCLSTLSSLVSSNGAASSSAALLQLRLHSTNRNVAWVPSRRHDGPKRDSDSSDRRHDRSSFDSGSSWEQRGSSRNHEQSGFYEKNSWKNRRSGDCQGSQSHYYPSKKSRNQGFLNNSEHDNTISTTARTVMEYVEPPDVRFREVKWIPESLVNIIENVFKFDKCSSVQAALLTQMPVEKDIVVQARTGTGKTLAFLIPVIIHALQQRNQHSACKALILSPTRELAQQIAAEAQALVRAVGLNMHCLIGGESRFMQISQLHSRPIDIIVATPGRAKDLLQTERKLQLALSQTTKLVLDEADRMLEIGFSDTLDFIISKLKKNDLQTLLFSATYPATVNEFVSDKLRPGFKIINTISPDESHTVESVEQHYNIDSFYKLLVHLHNVISRGVRQQNSEFKSIVFLPTGASIDFVYNLLRASGISNLYSLHGTMTQNLRTQTSKNFKAARCGVLLSTDVSARGLNYPNITLILQFGSPLAIDTYVHRVGRTARAGKSGEALLLLPKCDSFVLDKWKEMPIKPAKVVEGTGEILLSSINDDGVPTTTLEESSKAVDAALLRVGNYQMHNALNSWSAHYTSKKGKCPTDSDGRYIFEKELVDFMVELQKRSVDPNKSYDGK